MSLENLNSKELFIYSTNRSIKSKYEQDSICKPSMLRKEFFSKAIYYPHKTLLPKNVCKLLLGSILEQYDKETSNLSTSRLVFEKNFLAYLQSSAFFLQFYDELFIHNIDIADIPLQDTYGDYEEHLHILQEVFARYNAFLDSKHLVYKSRKYEILKSWLGNFSRIVLHLDSVLYKKWQTFVRLSFAFKPKIKFLIVFCAKILVIHSLILSTRIFCKSLINLLL